MIVSQPSESDQQQAVRSAQERTLGQYHQFMQINAASHLIRALRQLGLIDALREQQHTLQQLCTPGSLNAELVREILDAAVAIGIVEQYEDDYALSRAAHLLCQYDHDLADQRWERLVSLTRGESKRDAHDDRLHANHLAATQWIHTPAAMEAAEVLDFGGSSAEQSIHVLDLGCGSAVWSCAMAYRDPKVIVTAVDHAESLQAATSTAESSGLGDRFRTVAADPFQADLEASKFHWVVIALQLSSMGRAASEPLLKKAVDCARVGGQVVIIDLVEMGGKPTLNDRMDSLRIKLETRQGAIPTPETLQQQLSAVGLQECQFALLSKGRSKIGVAVAKRVAG